MSEWMKEPPTEPGWYWWRGDPEVMPIVRQIHPRLSWLKNGEWWPESITLPATEHGFLRDVDHGICKCLLPKQAELGSDICAKCGKPTGTQ